MDLKSRIFGIIACVLLFAGTAAAAPSAIVVDADTGKILVESHAKRQQYPASLTKIMTLYITFAAIEEGLLDWDDSLYVSAYASRQPKSKLYLKKGDTMTVEEAVKAVIVRSANDAAVVLAEAIGGSEEGFAEIMNDFAGVLEMHDTTFNNASGLTDEEFSSSALDMAKLSLSVMHHFPDFYPLFATKEFKFKGKILRTTNALLRTYQGGEGLKTGYTNKAGYNLAFSASKDEGRLIAITMGRISTRDRDRNMRRLLDQGFKKLKKENEGDGQSVVALHIPKQELSEYSQVQKNIRLSKALAGLSEEERRKAAIMEDEGGDWGMQVGAYLDEKQAIAAAESVLTKLFGEKDVGAIKVEETKSKKGGKLYLAQITSLSKYNAYEACVSYKKCLILRPKKPAATELAQKQ